MQVRKLASQRIREGGRLLRLADLANKEDLRQYQEGDIISLEDPQGEFLGRALLGQQNKGLGWVFALDSSQSFDADLVGDCLSQALDQRIALFEAPMTNAFRLFNGEGDGIGGVTLDYYAGHLVFNWYTRALHSYRAWFYESILGLLPETLTIFETKRFPRLDHEAAVVQTYGNPIKDPVIIQEEGISYRLQLGEDWMTGIFLDQRPVRQFVRNQAQGLSVLNLFSYTGAFGLAAAMGGASKTLNVDLANRSLAWTRLNYELNGLDFGQDHQVQIMDVFDYINYANRHHLSYDFLVCDPPSFARSKGMQFSVIKDYSILAESLFALVKPGGMILLSTNHSAYLKSDFQKDMLEASQRVGDFQLIQSFGLPEDFPTSQDETSHYLKVCVFYRVS